MTQPPMIIERLRHMKHRREKEEWEKNIVEREFREGEGEDGRGRERKRCTEREEEKRERLEKEERRCCRWLAMLGRREK